MGVCCSNTTETQSQEAVEEAVAVTDTSQSDWERLGGGEIEQPLRAELVKCVDSRFLVDHLQRGGRIERMQDLPSNAFISLEDLKRLGVYTCDFYQPAKVTYEWLPIIIVSYAWLGRSHPDPHAETLRVLVKALERMNPHGVIIDFTSLPQVPRTDEENKLFKEGLQMFNIFYSHPHTVVFQVTDFPAGYPSALSYDLPDGHRPAVYQHRGWCFAEACISSLGKSPKFLCNLSRLPADMDTRPVFHVVGQCMNEVTPPPLTPNVFNEQLAEKAFTQKTTDLARVQKLYADAFQSRIESAKDLMFAKLDWGPAEVHSFAKEHLQRKTKHLEGVRIARASATRMILGNLRGDAPLPAAPQAGV